MSASEQVDEPREASKCDADSSVLVAANSLGSPPPPRPAPLSPLQTESRIQRATLIKTFTLNPPTASRQNSRARPSANFRPRSSQQVEPHSKPNKVDRIRGSEKVNSLTTSANRTSERASKTSNLEPPEERVGDRNRECVYQY